MFSYNITLGYVAQYYIYVNTEHVGDTIVVVLLTLTRYSM